ncbi:MAG: hypothetical protein O8C67_14290 [Candidatus Methanoperedens sp.]|nr:hypothetical protein [Candidatus Methanoperedens sp.]
MKAEKKGGKTNNSKMVKVPCSICGMGMDCLESMLGADRHIAFYEPFAKVQEHGMEHYNYEASAKMFFLQGATSMLGLLISAGMPPEFLDELAEK